MKLWDISPVLSSRTAVFPGDTALSRRVARDYAGGANYLLSSIETTLHLGAHADAPNHYDARGVGIAERPLDRYLGPCQVITARGARDLRVGREHLATDRIEAPRVLVRTGSFPDATQWTDEFHALSPELVRWLATQGVRLVGIDTPSIDPARDVELLAHHAVYENDFAVLEGLVLDGVADGLYDLIALPLRLEGADASPVRAVLLPRGSLKE